MNIIAFRNSAVVYGAHVFWGQLCTMYSNAEVARIMKSGTPPK